jgi:hypothetical protein
MPEPVYRQRDPQNTPFYLCVEDHFEAFEQESWLLSTHFPRKLKKLRR